MTQHCMSRVATRNTIAIVSNGSTLGDYVRERRERLGMTLTALAASAELSKSELSALERGRISLPGADKRRGLARALGVSHLDLLIVSGEISAAEVSDKTGVIQRDLDSPAEIVCANVRQLTPDEVPLAASYVEFLIESRGRIRSQAPAILRSHVSPQTSNGPRRDR